VLANYPIGLREGGGVAAAIAWTVYIVPVMAVFFLGTRRPRTPAEPVPAGEASVVAFR
jgi:hypothetical protein